MRVHTSTTTASITSCSTMTEQVEGRIEKVLVLNGDASSALAALLSNLDAIHAATTDSNSPIVIAGNQVEALLALRQAAYGY